MIEKKDPSKPIFLTETPTGTSIDLGDDLLEQTGERTRLDVSIDPSSVSTPEPPSFIPAPLSPSDIPDQLQSARILVGEDMIEEAKKVLRQVLIADPANAEARAMLTQIHELELKQIFNEERSNRRRRPISSQNEGVVATEYDSTQVMLELDRDLALGMFSDEGNDVQVSHLSLFRDEAGMAAFAAQLDRDLSLDPPQTRVDLGIGFLEMGLYDLAIRQFQASYRAFLQNDQTDHALSAASLLAFAQIQSGHAFEATLTIQPVLNDMEIPKEKKIEFMYLMGRAHEAMKKPVVAIQWYAQVQEIDPHYRDIENRLRKRR